jgi:hypothetical protein
MVGWLTWVKYKDKLNVATALAMPAGTTPDALKSKMKSGAKAESATEDSERPRMKKD